MINVNCLNNIAACGLKLFSDEYNTESSFEDAQAVLVRSAKMHDMELSDNLLQLQEQELALIIFLLTNVQRKVLLYSTHQELMLTQLRNRLLQLCF